jgi:polyribonucleotide nucleotidyltransferase
MIQGLTAEAELNKIYFGKVKKITDFGAFVEILPGTDGLVHVSQLDNKRVEHVEDVLKEGDELLVKCIGIDPVSKKIKLSRKDALGLKIEDYKGK